MRAVPHVRTTVGRQHLIAAGAGHVEPVVVRLAEAVNPVTQRIPTMRAFSAGPRAPNSVGPFQGYVRPANVAPTVAKRPPVVPVVVLRNRSSTPSCDAFCVRYNPCELHRRLHHPDRTFRTRLYYPTAPQGAASVQAGWRPACRSAIHAKPPPPWPSIRTEGRIMAELAILIPVLMLALLVALVALLRN
jgi:hypothetical protein